MVIMVKLLVSIALYGGVKITFLSIELIVSK